MTEEQTTNPDVNDTEIEKPKEKKPRSMLQEEALHKARQKAYENRRLRAEQKKIKEESAKIETKLTEAEKDAEILKLKQLAHEKNLNVEISKPKPKPKPTKPKPTKPKTYQKIAEVEELLPEPPVEPDPPAPSPPPPPREP